MHNSPPSTALQGVKVQRIISQCVVVEYYKLQRETKVKIKSGSDESNDSVSLIDNDSY
jgi:rRNA-processing protein FCF1